MTRGLMTTAICGLVACSALWAQRRAEVLPRPEATCHVCSGHLGCAASGTEKKADLSNLVVAGDSLTAGFQNSQLIFSSQIHGYANVIAMQAGVDLNLPLLPNPGYPQITIEGGYAVATGAVPVARESNLQTRDLAVPGYIVQALVGYQAICNPNPADPFYGVEFLASEILNPNCLSPAPTQLMEAVALHPSTSILWIGANDVLGAIVSGRDPTDSATFDQAYTVAASTLAQASGSLVVANIPDVTALPYLTSVEKLAHMLGLPVHVVEAELGLHFGDKVSPYAFALIEAMGSSLHPLPETTTDGIPVVLRVSRLWQIRMAVWRYNAFIAQAAAASGAVVVDTYSLFQELGERGVVVNGQRLTTDFMGGIFSLDGVHPTNTGYAIVANEFIKTMNRCLAAGVPPISVVQVAKTDPLIFPDNHPGKTSGHVAEQAADTLRMGRSN